MAKLMTAEEAADYLRVPIRTLYDWRLKKAGPPALRVGKYLRFRQESIDYWLDQHADRSGAT